MSRSSKRTPAKTAPVPQERPVTPRVERPRHVPSLVFQDALLAEIRGMVADIEQAHIAPTYIMWTEIQTLLRDTLNKLYSRNLIEVGNTLNDRWIKPSAPDAQPK